MTEVVLGLALLVATFILGFIARKPAPIVPPVDTPIVPPEINYAETHKMDDDALPKPAATHSAQQLRDWAGDNVRDEE